MYYKLSTVLEYAPRVIQPSDCEIYPTPKQLITNLSHDCPLDLCLDNKNEQNHLEYLKYLGWGSHLAMFGNCIMGIII